MRIFEAELRDSAEDIQVVEQRHRKSYDRLKIEQCVYRENAALLEKGMSASNHRSNGSSR